jgi:choline-sulfatase
MSIGHTTLDRRQFLGVAAAGVVAPRGREKAPNILFICSDEHNYRVAGCYGNSLARTPNLDRLAARGVTFDAAYTNSPLCAPSRLAITSGKYIHRVGAWHNGCRLESDSYPSLPKALNAAGYESFLCGKQHYDETHRYGFREIGGNMNRDHKDGLLGRRRADDTSVNFEIAKARFAEFHAGEESTVMQHDRRVTTGVVDFLTRRERGDKPFFLFAGYLAPHFPLTVPERYWRNYRGKIALPEIPRGFLDSQPLNYRHLRWGFGLVDVPEETVRRGRELYYGFTEWVDNEIGQVLATLAKSAAAANTVIVYSTDHGENMGEHGLWWKNCMYEPAARIPLVVSWPERWKGSQRRATVCSLVDVVRTVAEIGGASTPGDWDGESLVRVLDDPTARARDIAISQYYAHNVASGFSMLRAGSWKYVYHASPDQTHPAERELYDMARDPMEFHNMARATEQRGRVERMHARLLKELGEDPEETEQRCRRDCAKGYAG